MVIILSGHKMNQIKAVQKKSAYSHLNPAT